MAVPLNQFELRRKEIERIMRDPANPNNPMWMARMWEMAEKYFFKVMKPKMDAALQVQNEPQEKKFSAWKALVPPALLLRDPTDDPSIPDFQALAEETKEQLEDLTDALDDYQYTDEIEQVDKFMEKGIVPSDERAESLMQTTQNNLEKVAEHWPGGKDTFYNKMFDGLKMELGSQARNDAEKENLESGVDALSSGMESGLKKTSNMRLVPPGTQGG